MLSFGSSVTLFGKTDMYTMIPSLFLAYSFDLMLCLFNIVPSAARDVLDIIGMVRKKALCMDILELIGRTNF